TASVAARIDAGVALFAGIDDAVAALEATVVRAVGTAVTLFTPDGLDHAVAAALTPHAAGSALAVTAIVQTVVALFVAIDDAIAAELLDLAIGGAFVPAAGVVGGAVVAAFVRSLRHAVAAEHPHLASGGAAAVAAAIDAVVTRLTLVEDAVA